MRAGREWQRIRLLPGRVRVQVSSPAPKICPVSSDGRAPVLQTGSRRLEPSTGYQIGVVGLHGVAGGQAGEFDSRTIHQDLSGHNSVAECLVANENVAGSIPADRSTRCWYIGCARAFQAREAGSSPARRSKVFRDVG